MILLVTDTSGRNGSVALARAGEGSSPDKVEVIGEAPLTGGTFSAQLVPQIAALLARHGLDKSDIGAFVVVSGPGSFTGLRVGLAAVKGLAEILQRPIVPVSLLEVVALAAGKQGRVIAALDGGRGEVFVGEYQVAGHSAQGGREQLVSKDEFLSLGKSGVVSTPDERLVAFARDARVTVFAVASPGSEAIARLGWRKLQADEGVAPDQLDANYMRRSDAEIFGKPSS